MNFKVAKRYAKGLFDFAEQTNETNLLYTEMQEIAQTIKDSKELKNMFKSPVVDSKKKQMIANQIFEKFSPSANKFIALVIQHGREVHLQDIAQFYIDRVDAKNHLQKITLVTATSLDQQAIDSIVKSSSFVDNTKPISVTSVIDESLIGGYILKLADKQLDTSIKAKLNQIRQGFDHNEYEPTK